jgi:hypothetical protein
MDMLSTGRDSLIRSAILAVYPRKQSRNRSIPTLASNSSITASLQIKFSSTTPAKLSLQSFVGLTFKIEEKTRKLRCGLQTDPRLR